jgi:hypothetical protein
MEMTGLMGEESDNRRGSDNNILKMVVSAYDKCLRS